MNEKWNLAELRDYIRHLGEEKRFLLDVVDSVDRSVLIFRYHLFTARDALKGIVDDHDPIGRKNFEFILGSSEQQKDFNRARLVSEANIIGCIHTARNIFDIFAQLVNGLALNSAIEIRSCNIHAVHDNLPPSPLKDCISELRDSDWFNYISGFINTTKHRRLIQHSFTLSFAEGFAEVRISAFKYNGRDYPAYWANEVLRGVVEVKNRIIVCGCALNRHCVTNNV